MSAELDPTPSRPHFEREAVSRGMARLRINHFDYDTHSEPMPVTIGRVSGLRNYESHVHHGSVASVRSHQKLPLAQRACIRALKPSNVSNAERPPRFVLANEQRRLRFVTGHAEWRVSGERMPGSGREL